ncbi:hypothetical protein FQN53_008640 [Emmonsiellopsis sp. PD_33]|nr:hypothetical protein FQN53_008640 [Emmonsiellopsis sp. PD_33]
MSYPLGAVGYTPVAGMTYGAAAPQIQVPPPVYNPNANMSGTTMQSYSTQVTRVPPPQRQPSWGSENALSSPDLVWSFTSWDVLAPAITS